MSEVGMLYGSEEWTNSTPHSQVFWATHGNDERRLRYKNKSFISFTYGGKFIEDFNLIAVNKNKTRMEGSIYASFSDNTSSFEVVDGQLYWGSHFINNKLSLQLATDYMTEEQYLDFKAWFKPGPPKELILAEHPNRAIMARINSTPQYHLLPFEEKVTRKFARVNFEVSTTVYKGEIDLEFVMDEPFWYSKYNVLPSFSNDGTFKEGDSLMLTLKINRPNNGYNNSLISNQDYLKIILEDGVPTSEMIRCDNLITGDAITGILEDPRAGMYGDDSKESAKVGDRLKSSIITINSLTGKNYLYYPGNAPAPTLLSFSLLPQIDTESGYITAPFNNIYNEVVVLPEGESKPNDYNILQISGNDGSSTLFKFTTPGIYTGYNQALRLINDDRVKNGGMSVIDLRILLTEGIGEYYSRNWALGVVNYLTACGICVDKETTQILEGFSDNFIKLMKEFLLIEEEEQIKLQEINYNGYNTPDTADDEPINDSDYKFYPNQSNISVNYYAEPSYYQFDSRTGVALGTFKVRCFKPEVEFTLESAATSEAAGVTVVLDNNDLRAITHTSDNNSDNIFADPEDTQTILYTGGNVKLLSSAENLYAWNFSHRIEIKTEEDTDTSTIIPAFVDCSEIKEVTENVGDMIYDKYLYLDNKTWYNNEGMITKNECLQLTTDYPNNLENFNLHYKYMYL